MAALLKFAPAHGVLTAAETLAGLNRGVDAALRRHAGERPRLVCHWQQVDGRLSGRWDIEASDPPVPPH